MSPNKLYTQRADGYCVSVDEEDRDVTLFEDASKYAFNNAEMTVKSSPRTSLSAAGIAI